MSSDVSFQAKFGVKYLAVAARNCLQRLDSAAYGRRQYASKCAVDFETIAFRPLALRTFWPAYFL